MPTTQSLSTHRDPLSSLANISTSSRLTKRRHASKPFFKPKPTFIIDVHHSWLYFTFLTLKEKIVLSLTAKSFRSAFLDEKRLMSDITLSSEDHKNALTDAGVALLIGIGKDCLMTIDINGCASITASAFASLPILATNLKTLKLCFCTDVVGKELIDYLPSSLEALEVNGCDCDKEDVERMKGEKPDVKLDIHICSCCEEVGIDQAICSKCEKDFWTCLECANEGEYGIFHCFVCHQSLCDDCREGFFCYASKGEVGCLKQYCDECKPSFECKWPKTFKTS
jgi:hypothetical protein